MEEKRLQRLTILTDRFVRCAISPEEQAELATWWREDSVNIERFVLRVNVPEVREAIKFTWEGERRCAEAWEQLNERLTLVVPLYRRHWIRWCVAGTLVFVLLVTGLWSITRSGRRSPAPLSSGQVNARQNEGNRPILRLSDGSNIELAAGANGSVIARDGSAQVVRQGSNRISYLGTKAQPKAVVYNTVSIPRGRTYQVVLSDGTLVWLNAESSLRFPTTFTGASRQVELTGEAYFEVAKEKTAPFVVKAGAVSVKVLGTHFDVQAYPEEKEVKATLLEGSVAVEAGDQLAILRPGEQARIGERVAVQNVDTDEVTAWKEGFMVFNNANIETIIRQISRYYNIRVVYRGEKKDWRLTGRVGRQTNAADMLEVLEANGFHFSTVPDPNTRGIGEDSLERE